MNTKVYSIWLHKQLKIIDSYKNWDLWVTWHCNNIYDILYVHYNEALVLPWKEVLWPLLWYITGTAGRNFIQVKDTIFFTVWQGSISHETIIWEQPTDTLSLAITPTKKRCLIMTNLWINHVVCCCLWILMFYVVSD